MRLGFLVISLVVLMSPEVLVIDNEREEKMYDSVFN